MEIKVAILFDKNNDWIFKFFQKRIFNFENISVTYFFNEEEVINFDVVFILGYTKILPRSFLENNRFNLVVHESDLPKGKGFSPVQWQILEGKSEITISLIEALEKFDTGDILLQRKMKLDGTELYPEIRKKQAENTIQIIEDFLKIYPNFIPLKQIGEESFYRKRNIHDSELDISKTISENFNLLRIGNNEEWPSFFYFKGIKYVLKIYKE